MTRCDVCNIACKSHGPPGLPLCGRCAQERPQAGAELAACRALVDAVLEEQRNASSDRVVHLAATAMEVRGG